MRQFIVTGHGAPTTPNFSLDDIAGRADRLDVLCRCVNSTFFLSYNIHEDVRAHLILGDEYAAHSEGSELRWLSPDERSATALIHKALEEREEAIGHMPAESSPGVSIRRMGLKTTLEEATSDAAVVELHEDGDPVVQAEPLGNPLFILSDHRDSTDEGTKLLTATADKWVRLGPEILHTDHPITVVHSYLGTADYSRY